MPIRHTVVSPTSTTETGFVLVVGALAPSLQEQLAAQGLQVSSGAQLRHLQRDVDAYLRLRIRGLLSEREQGAITKRLGRTIGDLTFQEA